MINDIVKYKTSVALFAANRLNLFEHLQKHQYFDLSICEKNDWNIDTFLLLCTFLEGKRYLSRKGDRWYLPEEVRAEVVSSEMLFAQEKMLYEKWIKPELIVESIRKGSGIRTFDKQLFNLNEQRIYDEVIYGKILHYIAFDLLRKMKRKLLFGMNILEYGRSEGKMSQTLEKYFDTSNITSLGFNDKLDSKGKYDLIIIYNSIHYKNSEEWSNILKTLKDKLKKKGVLCIIDFYYNTKAEFYETLLIDWMTCGGVHNISYDDVIKILETVGFSKFDKSTLGESSVDIIYSYK